ncbi:MAG TPA: ABC transporter substrate-binding protein [Vicinamibacteria bacterium]|nr:ABC transporter substrate-binding protein [Vicinamibacteria bacterium]
MPYRWTSILVWVVVASACSHEREPSGLERSVLRVALDGEPSTWNRLLATDWATHIVTDQLHAPLVRLNPETQALEPALAESWEFDEGGTKLVFHLREGLRFSDGEPFTARDVEFTFRALHDPRVASPLADTARIDGEPIECVVRDDFTVSFGLPRRTASIERIFDSIRILPAHRLERSLERGTLASDSGLGAAPEGIVGLGPFRLLRFIPGERILLERNPHYFKPHRDRSAAVESIAFEIIPDANARLLRLKSGGLDLMELDPLTYQGLLAEAPDEIRLVDMGPSMLSERLWFNLNPDSPIAEHKKVWFLDVRFRRAVSLSIDREALARVVYAGLASPAVGSVSPANSFWRNDSIPALGFDTETARALLAEAGFDWDLEGRLVDAGGRRVSFTVLTKSDALHSKIGSFLREDLEAIGVGLRAVPTESSSLASRIFGSFDYEAALLGISQTDPDPSAEMALWMSRAPLHLWHPSQSRAATPWEANIDELMEAQAAALDPALRRDYFDSVQRIIRENLPVLDLVVPHALLAADASVLNLRPTPFAHALWNSDELAIASVGKSTRYPVRDPRH